LSEEIIVDETNDLRAAVIAAAEVAREQIGLVLSTEEMPNPNEHRLFSWMQGRKWFNIERVKANVENTISAHGICSEDWEGVFRLLIPEITHVCFEEDGAIVISPWNDGYDF